MPTDGPSIAEVIVDLPAEAAGFVRDNLAEALASLLNDSEFLAAADRGRARCRGQVGAAEVAASYRAWREAGQRSQEKFRRLHGRERSHHGRAR